MFFLTLQLFSTLKYEKQFLSSFIFFPCIKYKLYLSCLSWFIADQTSELYLQHLFIPAGHPAVSQTSVPEQWLSLSHHISCWQQSDWEFQTDRDHSQDGSSLQARPGPHSLSLSQSPSLSWHLPPPASTEVQHDPWLVALAPQWCLGTYRVTT